MGHRSKIQLLDRSVREELDRMVRDGGFTIDQIVARLRELSGKKSPGRSAVGVYMKRAREQMQRYRDAQGIAKLWIEQIGEKPDGDVQRLLSEMLRSIAYQTIGEVGDRALDGDASPKELMLLARAIRDLAHSDRISLDRELLIRRQTAEKAAKVTQELMTSVGLDEEQARFWREKVLGVYRS